MRKLLSLLCLLGCLATGVQAQPSEGYARMLQVFRSNKYNLDAAILEKLVTINAAPEWWEIIGKENFNQAGTFTHEFSNLAGTVTTIATNLGLGDIRDTDRNNGYDGTNPLVLGMVDALKGKITFHIDMSFKPDAKSVPQVLENIDNLLSPLSSTNYFKPRGGKALVNIKVEPKAAKFSCKVSKDGNTYDIVFPAYAAYSQGNDVEPALKKGL